MVNYRTLYIGDRLHFHAKEADGVSDFDGIVTAIEEDHAVMTEASGMVFWIDDDSADLFIAPLLDNR